MEKGGCLVKDFWVLVVEHFGKPAPSEWRGWGIRNKSNGANQYDDNKKEGGGKVSNSELYPSGAIIDYYILLVC